jgi:hypothetical protein
MLYIQGILGPNYEPKNLKIKYETKNAFITMGQQREAEDFINKYQEMSNNNKQQDIYFSLYKSKIDRINTNSNFRRFNDMPNHMKNNQMNNMNSGYKSYNGNLNINYYITYKYISLYVFYLYLI